MNILKGTKRMLGDVAFIIQYISRRIEPRWVTIRRLEKSIAMSQKKLNEILSAICIYNFYLNLNVSFNRPFVRPGDCN